MTASLANEPFRVIGRERLFEASSFYSGYGHRHFDIHPDGERFLMINMGDRHAGQATLNVVLNWDFRFACPGWHLYTPEGRRAHETFFVAQSSNSGGRHLSPR